MVLIGVSALLFAFWHVDMKLSTFEPLFKYAGERSWGSGCLPLHRMGPDNLQVVGVESFYWFGCCFVEEKV